MPKFLGTPNLQSGISLCGTSYRSSVTLSDTVQVSRLKQIKDCDTELIQCTFDLLPGCFNATSINKWSK